MCNIFNLLAASPGYWFKQKTLYSDFDLLLSRFSTLQILYTIGFVIIGAISLTLWLSEYKKRKKGKFFQLKMNKENIFMAGVLTMVLFIIGTWLGR